jgi:hypothetical protein
VTGEEVASVKEVSECLSEEDEGTRDKGVATVSSSDHSVIFYAL